MNILYYLILIYGLTFNFTYKDDNYDGVNDTFHDSNGNGINDVDSIAYKHNFKFIDNDLDGINDLFRDQDGDGVNDILIYLPDSLKNKIDYIILDYNNDKINDITGQHYNLYNLNGYRYGFVCEETGKAFRNFKDENKNYMNDRTEYRMKHHNFNRNESLFRKMNRFMRHRGKH